MTASWKNKLFFELQSRNDWNSTLTPGSNSYFYPGMSLTYNFSEDITVPKLQFGKLRLSWANVGGGPSTVIETKYFADQSASVGSIYEGASIVGVTPSTSLFLGNIKPFRKREIEIGFNTRWFEKSRVEVDFSFYRNNIYDQIIQLDIDPASGYSDLKTNTGNTQNWGYELMIKGTPVISKNFRWDLTFTGAQQLSKVIDLNGGLKQQTLGSVNNSFLVLAKKGERQGDIYAYDFARDPSGNKIVNAGGNYSLDNSKYVNVGNVNPKLYGGLYSDFFLKGFNFHVGLDYRYGGKSFSYTNNYLIGNGVTKATLAYRDESKGGLAYYINGSNKKIPWQHNSPAPPGAAGGLVYHDGIILDGVMAVDQGGGNIKYEKNTNIISAPGYYQSYIQDGGGGWPPDRISKNDYVKIREASIDYTIPKSVSDLLRIQKLTISLAVRNLGYIYKSIPNIDAESTLGAQGFIENSFYPSLRTYTFGVNLSF